MLQRSKSDGHEATLLAASSLTRTSRATLRSSICYFPQIQRHRCRPMEIPASRRNLALAEFRPAEFLQQPRSTDFLVKVFLRTIIKVVKVRATIHDDSCVLEDASRGWRLVDEPEVARRRAERARFFFFSRARA